MIVRAIHTAVAVALLCAQSYATVLQRDASPEDQAVAARGCAAAPQELAHSHSKYFGTATLTENWGDRAYTDILDDCSLFGSLTPAYGMKWRDLQPAQDQYDYSIADQVVDKARDSGRGLRCHALVWPYQAVPQWLSDREWSRQELIDVMWKYITTVVQHYKGACESWDVVNEALMDDGSLRESIFLDVIGPEYITIAFQAAKSADPNVKLYYNDFNVDNDWSEAPPVASGTAIPYRYHSPHKARDSQYGRACASQPTNKIDGAKCLVNMVRNGGGKVDGIGLQGHYVYNSTPTADKLAGIMGGFAQLDLDVAITEFDIRMDFDNINDKTTDAQAQGYEDVITACRNTERCVGVTLWDFTDKYSWVTKAMPEFGSASLYDFNMVLKEKIWDAILKGWGGTEDAGAPCRRAAPSATAAANEVAKAKSTQVSEAPDDGISNGFILMGMILMAIVWTYL